MKACVELLKTFAGYIIKERSNLNYNELADKRRMKWKMPKIKKLADSIIQDLFTGSIKIPGINKILRWTPKDGIEFIKSSNAADQ